MFIFLLFEALIFLLDVSGTANVYADRVCICRPPFLDSAGPPQDKISIDVLGRRTPCFCETVFIFRAIAGAFPLPALAGFRYFSTSIERIAWVLAAWPASPGRDLQHLARLLGARLRLECTLTASRAGLFAQQSRSFPCLTSPFPLRSATSRILSCEFLIDCER